MTSNRNSEIDSFSETGLKPQKRAIGEIEFDNVEFSYPSRPDVPVSFPFQGLVVSLFNCSAISIRRILACRF
jgi:ABC-type multidrug transport system fused ATPase/permease subunit